MLRPPGPRPPGVHASRVADVDRHCHIIFAMQQLGVSVRIPLPEWWQLQENTCVLQHPTSKPSSICIGLYSPVLSAASLPLAVGIGVLEEERHSHACIGTQLLCNASGPFSSVCSCGEVEMSTPGVAERWGSLASHSWRSWPMLDHDGNHTT